MNLRCLVVTMLPLLGCATAHPCVGTNPEAWTTEHAQVTPYRLEATDQTCLQAYEWKPSVPVKGTLVIVHGVRDHASRYGELADTLASKGIAVYAQDHRGHGLSGGPRQRFDSMEQLIDDIDHAVAEAKMRNPGAPTFLYGHSMGGLASTEYALAHPDKLQGLVLSGAALKLSPGVGGGTKAAAKVFSAIIPGLKAQALDDTQFTREQASKDALAKDDQVDHENLPARSAAAVLYGQEDALKRYEEVKLPLLVMHGTSDKATNPEGSKEFTERASSKDKTLKLWDGVYHDLIHEPEHAQVCQLTTDWVVARLGTP